MLYKTQSIIIKKTDLAQADRLLTIYTKDFGKIKVLARAVKKSQAKLKGHLELFIHSHLMLAPGRNLDIITSAETIENFPSLRCNLPSLATAYYFTELIDKLIVAPEQDEKIWRLLLSTFQNTELSCGRLSLPHLVDVGGLASHMTQITSNFENKLLEFLGYDLTDQPDKQNPISFIQSIIGERINSKNFLEKIKKE